MHQSIVAIGTRRFFFRNSERTEMAEMLRLQSSQRKFAVPLGLGYERKYIMKVTLCQVSNFIDTFGFMLDFEH